MSVLALALVACVPVTVEGDGPPDLSGDTGLGDGGLTDGGADGGTDGGGADGGASDGGGGDGGTTDGGAGDGGLSDGPVLSWAVEEHDEVSTILVVQWELAEAVDAAWLSFEVDGDPRETPVRAWEAGDAHEVLLGIPEETDVPVTLWVEHDGATTQVDLGTHQTGRLPGELAVPDLVVWDPTAAAEAPFVLASVDVGSYDFYGPCYTVIIDRQGRIVWYYESSNDRLTLFPRVSRIGGHLTIDATVYYVYDGSEASITRTTLDLEQRVETEIPGFGFSYDELPDGSFVFDHAETGYQYHLERLYMDGDRDRIWSCYPWMSEYTTQYWGCAVNTVLWSPERDSVLWSMFETSTFTEIDLDSGEQLWHAGQVPDGFDIIPSSSMLELQHYPNWTPDGTILTTTHVQGSGSIQAIREFQLDEDEGTLTDTWTYIPADGHYGAYAGDVTRLDNGNTLIGYGTDGVVQEVTTDGQVAWELSWGGHLTGHMTLIDDLYELNQGW